MSEYKSMIVATCLAAAVLTGCGRSTDAPPAPTAVAIPATLFASSAPAGAVPLLAAREDAKPGDRVVFTARVGGRRAPFVENRAVFFVADPSLETCDQIPGDTCKYPWDYCCEPPDRLRAHMAAVRVLDEAGQPLAISLDEQHGLAPLKTVVVSGTARIDDAGNFAVDADAIYVGEG